MKPKGNRLAVAQGLLFWSRFADDGGLHRASVAATAVVWAASVGFADFSTAAGAYVLRHCT